MKKRIVSLLLALALLVLPVVSAGAAQPAAADPTPVQTQTDAAAESDQHCYSYIALGDSIVAGIGLPGAVYQRNGRYYDVSGNYQGYSKDCYVARVADSLGLSRAQTANYGMPALMSSDLLELVRTGSCQSASINFVLPNLRQELSTLRSLRWRSVPMTCWCPSCTALPLPWGAPRSLRPCCLCWRATSARWMPPPLPPSGRTWTL